MIKDAWTENIESEILGEINLPAIANTKNGIIVELNNKIAENVVVKRLSELV
jgi:broad-specificity NMP kinase